MFKQSRDGRVNYSDLTTATVPIAYVTGSPLKLTNDGAGAQTLKTYKAQGTLEMWNTVTNQLNFSNLSLGDEVTIRVNLNVTTSAPNQIFSIYSSLAIGGVSYTISDGNRYYKSASTYQIGTELTLYMGNADTITYPAEIMFTSDANATIRVNGFYISVKRR